MLTMGKILHKITAILVSSFLLVSMTFMGAWASSGTPSYTPPPDSTNQNLGWNMTGEGAGVSDSKPYYYHPSLPYGFNAETGVNALVYDADFDFVGGSKSTNFDSAAEAIRETAPDKTPLMALLKGGSGNYYIQWSFVEVDSNLDDVGTPTTSPEEHITGMQPNADGLYEFTRSITAADGIADNKMYKFVITAYKEDKGTPATYTIYVSTYKDYEYRTIGANDVFDAITNATGFIYTSLATMDAGLLRQGDISSTSSIVADMMNAAASTTEDGVAAPKNITKPTQLEIYNIDNKPANMPAYLFNLDLQLEIDKSIPELAGLQEGDEVPVYRYNPDTGMVQELEGVVGIAYDENGDIIRDSNGDPVLCVKTKIKGGSAALGVFAIGYDSAGKYTLETAVTGNGQITPYGKRTLPLEAQPEFALYPMNGYVLDSVSILVGNRNYTPIPATDTNFINGNVFRFDPGTFNVRDGNDVVITANFVEATPQDPEYDVTVSLSGKGNGTVSFISGAALIGVDSNGVDTSNPAMTETTVNMGTTEGPISMPSSAGVLLAFNTGIGFHVESLKINGIEYKATGTSYYVPALVEDLNIEVVYGDGMTDPATDVSVNASIEDEPAGKDAAFILDPDNSANEVKAYTYKIVSGSDLSIQMRTEADWKISSALAYYDGIADAVDVTSMVNVGNSISNLHLFNVVSPVKVEFRFKHVDTTLTLAVDGSGGSISPCGTVDMSQGERLRVIMTPDSSSYVLGSLKMDGTNITSLATSRNDGAYYTITVVKSDSPDANDGIWTTDSGAKETDQVVYINDRTSEIRATFDTVANPAPAYATIRTSVAGIGNGSITPTQMLNLGDDATVCFFPDKGYKVKSVTLDGKDVTSTLKDSDSKLVITNVQSDHDVVVTFTNGDSIISEWTKHKINPTSSSGGFISPDSETLVYDGGSQKFYFFPMTGYVVSKLYINGSEVTPATDPNYVDNSYTFTNVKEDKQIHVTFAKEGSSKDRDSAYTIIVKNGEHGKTSPVGVLTIAGGASLPITIMPDDGYTYDKINVKPLGSSSSGINMASSVYRNLFTYFDVQENLEIEVTFRELGPGEDIIIPTPIPENLIIWGPENSDVAEGATLQPPTDGLVWYKQFGRQYASTTGYFTVVITPGYKLDFIKVNGHDGSYTQTGDGVYSLVIPQREITEDTLIEIGTTQEKPSISTVNTKTVTVTAEGNGQVSPATDVANSPVGKKGVFQIETGKSQTFYFYPDPDHKLDAVYVNDVLVATDYYSLTLSSITTNTHVRAVFVEGRQSPAISELGGTFDVAVEIDPSADGKQHGSVSPSMMRVMKGGSATFTFVPEDGYKAHLYDGTTEITDRMSGNSYTIGNITANKTLTVRFDRIEVDITKYHNVTVTHEDHGWVSPEGITRVLDGGSVTLNVIPDAGYTLDKLTVDGQQVNVNGGNLTYTLSNITKDTEVHATFKTGSAPSVTRYNVLAYTSAGGMVSPTAVQAALGTSQTFTFIPLQGYKLVEVIVNGGAPIPASSLADGTYTLTDIRSDYTIVGNFERAESSNPETNHYTVFVQAGKGGSISPDRAVSVPAGGSQTFTIIPDAGYKVKSLTIITFSNDNAPTNPDDPDNPSDPNRLETHVENFSGSNYTLFNITANKTFRVDFEPLKDGETTTPVNTFDITATASANGSVSPAGTTKVAAGAMSFYSFIPTAGHKLSYVVVDGINIPAAMITNNQYIFSNVLENHTIHAVFCPVGDNVADFVTVVVDKPLGGTIAPYGDNGSVLVRKGEDATFKIASIYGYKIASIEVNGASIPPNKVDTASYSFDGANFTFKRLQSDSSLSATFTKMDDINNPTPKYTTITIKGCEDGAGGTTSYGNGTSVIEELPAGGSLDVSFIPDSGKAIKEIVITYPDGTREVINAPRVNDIWQKGFMSFTDKQVNGGGLTIEVTWRNVTSEEQDDINNGIIKPAKYHEIIASSTGSGSINPTGHLKIANGASLSFTLTPNAGSELTSLKVDGNDVVSQLSGSRTYTFGASDTNDHSIEAAFSVVDSAIDYYTIEASSLGNGRVSPEKVEVAGGQSMTINFFPDAGYKLTSISIDGGERIAYNGRSYTFANIAENHSLKAYFNELDPGETGWDTTAIEVQAKVASDPASGSVSPESVLVPLGSAQTFTLKPGNGFEVDYITFNGDIRFVPAGTTSYTVTPLDLGGRANVLEVYYKMIESNRGDLTVTAKVEVDVEAGSAGNGSGTVTPPSKVVPYGGSATFYIMPDPGSTIGHVRVNGQPIPYSGVDGEEHTYLNGWDGGPTTVNYTGGATTSTALYRGGANLSTVADGDNFYSTYRATIPNITGDVTLEVSFRKITEQKFDYITSKMHELVITSEGGGTVSPVGSLLMPEGDTDNIRFKTFTGYYLDSVMIEYYKIEDGKKVTVKNVDVTNQVNGQTLPITMGEYNMHVHAKYKIIGTPSTVTVGIGSSKIPVLDADGNPTFDPEGNPVFKDVEVTSVNPTIVDPVTGKPVELPRNVVTTFTFHTDEKGPNGRGLVLDKVFYNGKEIEVLPGSNTVQFLLDASGEFEIIWRELREDEEPIIPPDAFNVNAIVVDGTGGKISPAGSNIVYPGDSISFAVSTAEDGWLISSIVKVANPGTDQEEQTVVDANEYKTGIYTLYDVQCDYEIRVTFIEAQRVYVEWNNDEGYVTPNTAPGEYIYVAKDTSLNFVVAPYFGYEVEGVWVENEDMTDDLKQTAAARDTITGLDPDNKIVYMPTNEGDGVAGFVANNNAGSGSGSGSGSSGSGGSGGAAAQDIVQGALDNMNDGAASVEATQKSFARAYEFQTPLLNKGSRTGAATADDENSHEFDIKVLATFVKDPNQNPNDNKHHVSVSVADNVGGTVTPTEADVEHGQSLILNFHPDAGYKVAYLIINGNTIEWSANSYTIDAVTGDMDIEVVFAPDGSIPGPLPVSRVLRTLQALAQTGDLNGPAIVLLLTIAALALFLVALGARRRKKDDDDDYRGPQGPHGPRGPMGPGGFGGSGRPGGGQPVPQGVHPTMRQPRPSVGYGMR